MLAMSADPNEIPPHVAFHLGLLCLPKYLFLAVPRKKRVKNWITNRNRFSTENNTY